MPEQLFDLPERLYSLVRLLPRHDYRKPLSYLGPNGIYFFFECGETITLPGAVGERIVRVGTHQKDNRFPLRIRQHSPLDRRLCSSRQLSQ